MTSPRSVSNVNTLTHALISVAGEIQRTGQQVFGIGVHRAVTGDPIAVDVHPITEAGADIIAALFDLPFDDGRSVNYTREGKWADEGIKIHVFTGRTSSRCTCPVHPAVAKTVYAASYDRATGVSS
jgi:hypothetical protein